MKILVLLLLGLVAVLADPSETLAGFTSLNNQFTADVYKVLKKSADNNFVVCPLSVEILLALIHAGAEGKTARELSTALRLPQKRAVIDEIYRELHPKLQADNKYTLQTANKVYVRKNYSVKDQYRTTAEEVFGADIESIDFSRKSATVSEINNWVSRNTRGKINQLVQENDITAETRAVLLNAIYFKGKWVSDFKKILTKSKPFYITKKSYVEVDMMEQTNYFRYYASSNLDAKFLELPYEGDNITMTVVLPNDKEGLPTLEERIHEVVMEHDYRLVETHLRMPKYKVESSFEFTPILKKLGIREAFKETANLQQMLNTEEETLYLSKVVQKALIETDEEGTVAAAVSGGYAATALSLPASKPKPINFHVNYPFIFFLKHKDAGIFFIGRYAKPLGTVINLEQPVKDSVEVDNTDFIWTNV